MSPLSGLVLGSAAVVSSPAWWATVVDGTQSLEAAAVRFSVALVVCWGGWSLLTDLALAPVARDRAAPADGLAAPDVDGPAGTSDLPT